MFEQAVRLKLRFDSPKGLLTVEDLWDLPLTGKSANLDDIAKGLSRKIKASSEESFVITASKSNTELELAFNVVKHVISVRLEENAAELTRKARKDQKEQLLQIISKKRNEKLENSSLEELEAAVAAL